MSRKYLFYKSFFTSIIHLQRKIMDLEKLAYNKYIMFSWSNRKPSRPHSLENFCAGKKMWLPLVLNTYANQEAIVTWSCRTSSCLHWYSWACWRAATASLSLDSTFSSLTSLLFSLNNLFLVFYQISTSSIK